MPTLQKRHLHYWYDGSPGTFGLQIWSQSSAGIFKLVRLLLFIQQASNPSVHVRSKIKAVAVQLLLQRASGTLSLNRQYQPVRIFVTCLDDQVF